MATMAAGIQRTRFGWLVPPMTVRPGEDRVYQVEWRERSGWSCSCEEWYYRCRRSSRGRLCKHVGAVWAMLLDAEGGDDGMNGKGRAPVREHRGPQAYHRPINRQPQV